MKFLVDAQLPRRVARFLQIAGYDTLHTRDLPRQNATSDQEINALSVEQKRIVITKDIDFLNSFLTRQEPYKLLLITTGNISNAQLEVLFQENLPELISAFEQYSYVEMSREVVIVYQ
jgi:predicted nuclease of predicted toxin-antitoxin system